MKHRSLLHYSLFTFRYSLLLLVSVNLLAQSPLSNTNVILIRPNGGEVFLAGSYELITWDSLKSGDTVMRLEYSTTGGTSWNLIKDKPTGTSYSWLVPVTPSDSCLARMIITQVDSVAIDSACAQKWMKKNLDVDTYRDGTPIPQVTDPVQWRGLTTGAWCYYNNDPAMGAIYGKLYNWYAVNDPRGLAPIGWHVPSDSEWKALEMCLGMTQAQADASGWRGTTEGGKLKEAGTAHWSSPNTGATNSNGFTALPAGDRNANGWFLNIGHNGYWWSATKYSASNAWYRSMYNLSADVLRSISYEEDGLSVRCVRD